MKRILVTGCGAPGTFGTYRMITDNPDNERVRIIATDIDEHAMGRMDANQFHLSPPATDPEYPGWLMNTAAQEDVDVIIPQNTMELLPLAAYVNNSDHHIVMLNSLKSIEAANDKLVLSSIAKSIGIPTPETTLVNNVEDFWRAKWNMVNSDYIVAKIPVGNGSRGVRIVKVGYKPADYFFEKPSGMVIPAEHIEKIYELHPDLDLMVQEYLPGAEYTIDVMGNDGGYLAIPRRRDKIKSGITSVGTVEKHGELREWCVRLSANLGLSYPHGYQFKEDEEGVPRLLECNPRVQGTMIASHYAGWNIIWDGVRIAMGLEPHWNTQNIKWGTRVIRYSDVMKFGHNIHI